MTMILPVALPAEAINLNLNDFSCYFLHVITVRAGGENPLVSPLTEGRSLCCASLKSVAGPSSHICPVYAPLYNPTKFILKTVK